MSDCLFCRIVEGKLPAKRLYEDDRCVVIQDINPGAPVHALVLPRRHIATVSDLAEADDGLVGHLVRTGGRVAREQGVADSGYRLVFNTNRDAGQSVFHIHLHVLGGRPLDWPPG